MTCVVLGDEELENMSSEGLLLLADSIGVGYKEYVGSSGLDEEGLKKKIRTESLE